LRFWSFVHYVSTHHPDLFGVDLSAQMRDRCEELIARANPPPVILKESERARMIREFDEREGSA
jgi:hypothetical protein